MSPPPGIGHSESSIRQRDRVGDQLSSVQPGADPPRSLPQATGGTRSANRRADLGYWLKPLILGQRGLRERRAETRIDDPVDHRTAGPYSATSLVSESASGS